ncbi:MAG: hypothetical protein HZA34_03790 [Candidatus Pacebacteria bacterium]|nr:hypothetical protein [Candidatus Paceibacterota bacterium]
MPKIEAVRKSDIPNIPKSYIQDLEELRVIIESIEVATDQVLYYVSAAHGGVLTFIVLNMISKDIPKFRVALDKQLPSQGYQRIDELLVDRHEASRSNIVTFKVK